LFHKELGFFGRTYTSRSHRLLLEKSLYQAEINDYIIYHSSLNDIQFVIEFIVQEQYPDTSKVITCGWSLTDYSERILSLNLRDGSPRLLLIKNSRSNFLSYQIAVYRKTGSFSYNNGHIQQEEVVTVIKKYIPANCVCGPNDVLSEFSIGHLPFKRDKLLKSFPSESPLVDSHILYITSCIIQIPHTLETYLYESMRTEFGVNGIKVVIGEYRIHIGVHNQWKFVNTHGIKNSIGCIIEGNNIRASGILKVDEVTKDTALVFQLIASINLSRENKHIDQFNIVLGEYVNLTNYDDIEVYGKMNIDSEKSLVGSSIWTPPEVLRSEDWSLTLMCEASTIYKRHEVYTEIELNEEKQRIEHLKALREHERKVLEEEKEKAYHEKQEQLKDKSMKLVYEERSIKRQALTLDAKKISVKHAVSTKENTGELKDFQVLYRSFILPKAPDITEDLRNKYKASVITVDFLGFKLKGALLGNNELVPKKICVLTKFFNFPTAQSPSLMLKQLGTHPETVIELLLGDKVPKWTNTSSMDLAGKHFKMRFMCDPGADHSTLIDTVYEDFLLYLARNVLKIFVFNAEGLLPIGVCKVYLGELLRSKESIKVIKKEYDIFSEDNQLIGSLQLFIQNIGQKHKGMKELSNVTPRSVKKTKIKSKPVTIADIEKLPPAHANYTKEQSEEIIKMKLMYRYKLSTSLINQKSPMKPLIEDIEKYRTVSRIVNPLLKQSMKHKDELFVTMLYLLGQIALCFVPFTNPYGERLMFEIEVYDEANTNEFQMVTDPDEWKYFLQKTAYDPPNDWDMFLYNKKFYLNPNEHVTILFKMFCLSPPKYKETTIRIVIKTNTKIVQQNSIKAVYKETYYNSYFICNEPESTLTELILKPDIDLEVYERIQSIVCSDKEISVSIINNTIKLNTPIKKEHSVYVFLYSDEYHYDTLCIIQVTIKPHRVLEVREIAGVKTVQNFTLSSHGINRTVQLYSGNNKLIRVADGYSSNVEISAKENKSIPLCITPYRIGRYKEYLYCKGNFLFNFRCK